MPTALDYAQLAAFVHANARGLANTPFLPASWEDKSGQFITTGNMSGFSAGVFTKGTDIVIAFEGTNPNLLSVDGIEDLIADAATFAGLTLGQVQAAALLYEQVKEKYGSGYSISFTGHSLGGGLASLMSVFFNRSSTNFDPAPFAVAASNPVGILAVTTYLLLKGYPDSDLGALLAGSPLVVVNPIKLVNQRGQRRIIFA